MAFALLAPRPNSHSFQERQLSLKEPIKIGRAVAKAKASQTNGIFDCKVLSRNHAILWYENGKFMLQDTKSSNGTYVNSVRLSRGSEESEPCEVKSGDILQFGVEVVENSKNVTHGCIVGLATLFHEDGSEATGSNDDSQGVLSLLNAEKGIQPNELWQLSQFLQDALHREQMLENKLATLQRMISNSHAASEDTFQGFIQEDKVLSRLETLENQLELLSKDLTEADAESQLISYQGERLQYESAAKETLQRILTEKIDVLQKCSDLERLLSNAEDECAHLKTVYDKSKSELSELMEKHRSITDEINQLKEELLSANQRHESIQQQTSSEKQELKSMLEDAEKRGSSLAVEVESLQAECDFTKQQLEAMKERLEQKQKSLEEEETEKHDLPFASDHATLEKDVKNKTALIRTLKNQLSELQIQLEKEREKAVSDPKNTEKEKETTVIAKEQSSGITSIKEQTFEAQIENIKDLKALLHSTRISLLEVAKSPENFESLKTDDICDDSLDVSTSEDIIQSQNDAIVNCKDFLRGISKNLQTLLSKDSVENISSNSTEDAINVQLSEAHNELKDVKKQILVLGEQLIEEQEINKKSKELAASLEHQLSETHRQIDLEKLDKSTSCSSLKSARKVAEELKTEANNSGAHKDKDGSVLEENEKMKSRLMELENECKQLKKENSVLVKKQVSSPRLPTTHKSPGRSSQKDFNFTDLSMESNECSFEELQDQLVSVNQSLEELSSEKEEEIQKHEYRQHQMLNVIMTLVLMFIVFGLLVMLGLVDISPGKFPLLDEHTWNELLEHLF